MPPFEEDDTRKVQTAVVGRAGSDRPVFLPYDPADFDAFMRDRTREDFYCGTLLGGCGKKLTAKRYTEKKCHFAHRPPVHCRRRANGETSADHLYIGQALTRWLRGQGHHDATVTYPDLGSGPGGAVEVRFAGGDRIVRVQMDRLPLPAWRETRERLDARHAAGVHWAYGPDSGLAHNEADAHGHAIRFSCRTERGTREVYVGRQVPGRAVESVPLDDCHLTERGVATPGTGAPVSFPLAPGSVAFTGAIEIPSPAEDGVRLYRADAQPLESGPVRARVALPSQYAVPPHLVHVLEGAVHLVPPSEGSSTSEWLIRAEAARPLTAMTDPRWPDLVPPPRLAAPAAPAAPAAAHVARTSDAPLDTPRLLAGLRRGLIEAAQRQEVVDWETLVRSAGEDPERFSAADQVRLLVELDLPRAVGKPVLSSLLTTEPGMPAPMVSFAAVLAGLGWRSDLPADRVTEIWERQRRTAYSLLRRNPEPAPEPDPEPPVAVGAPDPDEQLVDGLRVLLRRVAKGRSVIKWETLLRQQGVARASITPQERIRLLAAVDAHYRADGPLLSALVKAPGLPPGPPSYFGEVLKALGWRPTTATPTVAAAWTAGRNWAYRAAGHASARTAIPADGPPVSLAGLSRQLGIEGPVIIRTVRRVLTDAARRQVCVGWHTLAESLGRQPKDFSDRHRLAVLVAVDRASRPTGVVLSALVIGVGHAPVPYFADILRALGRPHDLRPIELGQVRKREQARAFAAYATTPK
ncbi:competence protein CoiA family protein [Streptomyces erythrochromogenes]|uniref:competence protein CoiA family protein n=1 Tax=Streptomyces erythrochromogenes TaxID=285574 RepID=UPI00386CD9E1|nr:competence protein CoiA [Streptomyces erythrochromogenes]